ncbi:LGFP repeat-containing protein [Oryzobacter sp. R7]|uniref:LGFP repeat-containing protein n=1 Tax=Oryzobacter faecalis TaxID=3388656 RepID=UPI00398CF5C5
MTVVRPEPAAPGSSALDDVLTRPSGLVRLVDRLSRGRSVSRRGFFVGAAVAGSALATNPRAYALMPQSAYATICGPSTTYSGGWSIFCATVNKGVNACPPGSFTAGWWKAADSSWCGGGYRYIVDCNAKCTKCTSGCSDHICDSKCWNCSCRAGSTATCDQRRECCNAFRYGQCNTQVKCSGGVHCRVVSCVAPYSWDNCSTTSFRSDATAEHSSPYLPQWGPIEKQYKAMGAQRSYLRASTGPIRSAADGRGRYVDYQGGRIWWTSTTPAVAMTSAVSAFYAANGGIPELGYPKAQRSSALVDGGWIHVFEKGCIVDSASTATQVVSGPRWSVWVAAGRETGALGYPVAALETLAGGAWLQRFQAGGIVDSAATSPVAVDGIRWTRWVASGRETGPLGFPVAARQDLASWSWIQRFQTGCLVDSPWTTPTSVHGAVWVAWQQVGREGGRLSFPTAEQVVTSSGVSQRFRGGGIWGPTGSAAYAVFGAVLSEWEDAGGTRGRYGYPVQHTVVNPNGTTTGVFEGGTITA